MSDPVSSRHDARLQSGVGVLDKSVAVLGAVAEAEAPLGLAELVTVTGLTRATAHRLAVALVAHGLLRRTGEGRFALGLRLVPLGRAAAADWPLAESARPALEMLRESTGESVQLYVRDGEYRVCVASLHSDHELRTIVEEGARLPLGEGSAGRILAGEVDEAFEGWTASAGERASGVGSVSAPVIANGELVAAVGISGPLDRLGPDAGPLHGPAVVQAASAIAAALA